MSAGPSMDVVKICPNCERKLIRRSNEAPCDFAGRRFCNRQCVNEWTRFKRPIEHGTYAGVKQHRARKEAPCDVCRPVENGYRRSKTGTAEQQARRSRQANARSAAVAALIRKHQGEFFDLCTVEYEKAGVPR